MLKHNRFLVALTVLTTLLSCNLLEHSGKDEPPKQQSKENYTISIPTQSATLSMDSSYQVSWVTSPSDIKSDVSIALYQEDTYCFSITKTISDGGMYTWNLADIPRQSQYMVGSGLRYRIKITSTSDTSKWDFSPYFSISSPYQGSLSITAPTIGKTVEIDSSLTIEWNSDGNLGPYIGIQLLKDSALVSTISTTALDKDFYTWPAVGTPLGTANNYHIRIFSVFNPSINSISPAFQISSIHNSTLTITLPQLGDTVFTGKTHLISWTQTGNPGNLFSFALYQDSNFVSDMTPSISLPQNSTTAQWNVSAGLSTGSNYRIKISSLSNPAIFSFSDQFNVFGIAPEPHKYDSISAFTSPDAKASWLVGRTSEILWTPDSLYFGKTINLKLYKDSAFLSNIATQIPNSGSYTWAIPSNLSTSKNYQIKISSDLNTSAYSYSPKFLITGLTPDDYEPDNDFTTSKPIKAADLPQPHTLTSSESDWIHYRAKPGAQFFTIFNSNSPIYVYTYDSTGKSYGSFLGGTKFSFTTLPTQSAAYYHRIQSNYDNVSYTVDLVEIDSLSGNIPLHFASPESTTTWIAGSVYPIKWIPDSLYYGNTVKLSLYIDSNFLSNINVSAYNNGELLWSIPKLTYTSSKYRIKITSTSNTNIYAFSPTFSISGISADIYEPDNILAEAKEVMFGGTEQSRSLSPDSPDWIRFQGVVGMKYITAIHSTVPLSVGTYNASGNLTNTTTYGSHYSTIIAPQSSGWYFQNISTTFEYGTYTLKMIEFDTSKGGLNANFEFPDSTKIWTSGSNAQLVWSPDSVFYGSYVTLSLYHENTPVQTIYTGAINSGSAAWMIPITLVTSNRYRIRIQNYNSPSIYGHSNYFTIHGVAPDSLEPDNNFGKAKSMTSDGIEQKHNLTTNDTDWIKLPVQINNEYSINLRSNSLIDVQIYDEKFSPIFSQTTLTLKHSFKSAQNGSVYIRVNSSDPSVVGLYYISATFIKYGIYGYEGLFSKPTSMSTLKADSTYQISWSPEPSILGNSICLELFMDTTHVMFVNREMANNGSYVYRVFPGLANGSNYRFLVRNLSNVQKFTMSANFQIMAMAPDSLEPNNIPINASLYTPNQGKIKLSLATNDIDWFKFTCTKNSTLNFNESPISLLANSIRIYQGLGQSIIISHHNTSGTPNTFNWVCPETGTYSFSVEPYSVGYYGDYELTVTGN